MSGMRNKLTTVESRNVLLEQERDDLTGTVNILKSSVKSEPGRLRIAGFQISSYDDNLAACDVPQAGSLDHLMLVQRVPLSVWDNCCPASLVLYCLSGS